MSNLTSPRLILFLSLVHLAVATAGALSPPPSSPSPPTMTEFPPPKDYSHLIVDGWFHERGPLWPGQAFTLQIKEVLYHKKSRFQDVLVFESEQYGTVLVLDGVIQCTERDECR